MLKRFVVTTIFLAICAATVAAQSPPTLRIVTETPGLPSELFYGDIKVKPLRLRPGTNTVITIDDADFFVQNLYIDNLRRFPDAPGFAHWLAEITMCSNAANRNPGETEPQCVDRKRTNDAGAFFLAPEAQYSGSFLVRVNWGSLGQLRDVGQKCIIGQHAALDAVCRPLYSQYLADMVTLTNGIIVNNALDGNKINQNKQTFVNQFVTRSDFLAQYPAGMPADQYVDGIASHTGVALTAQQRTDLIANVTSPDSSCTGFASGRACVLWKMVDGVNVISEGNVTYTTPFGKAYYDNSYNSVFVFIEYIAWLRRNPDQGGYDHWLGKLNFYGNFVDAEMVRSFIVSPEYRDRF
jgi:uncharacterized protein DUF4214